ncbi:DUF3313 family protein [Paraferrimonas sp. SM1919]|uniref:DUF3313 family protein n=1 Tax=Paraferrimonas sp. SM1919 TaxID=2662263 RepID=UPI0013D8D808|nr:DUF3313 family protein [Paraferrimonas sp. SM1919]
MKAYSIILLTFSLLGCQSTPIKSDINQHNYTQNTDDALWQYSWVASQYQAAEALQKKFSGYNNFTIKPTITVSKNSDIDEETKQRFIKHLEQQTQLKLSQYKSFQAEPGERTLAIQFAISNFERPNSVLATTSTILPIGLGISAVSKAITGEHTNVVKAQIEVMISDSQTGEQIFSAIDIRTGEKGWDNISDPDKQIIKIIDNWILSLIKTIDSEK